jgi:hypothetical protein
LCVATKGTRRSDLGGIGASHEQFARKSMISVYLSGLQSFVPLPPLVAGSHRSKQENPRFGGNVEKATKRLLTSGRNMRVCMTLAFLNINLGIENNKSVLII